LVTARVRPLASTPHPSAARWLVVVGLGSSIVATRYTLLGVAPVGSLVTSSAITLDVPSKAGAGSPFRVDIAGRLPAVPWTASPPLADLSFQQPSALDATPPEQDGEANRVAESAPSSQSLVADPVITASG
jgi:hypothetical protein